MLAYLDTLIGFAVVMLGASLSITILTQMISALFSHRGANLLWGLKTMFKNLPDCPLLNDANTAAAIAKSVLTHPLISDSIFSLKPKWLADRIRLAKAIDPDELIAILRELSTTPPFANLRNEIQELIDARNLSSVHATGKLEAWFNATMDRVSARFATYVRLWTVAFALALALGTGLNSVTLLSGLYTNGAFREAVAASAPRMMDIAAEMYNELVVKAIGDSKATADATPSGIGSEPAARAWIVAHVTPQSATLSAFDQALATERVQDAAALRNILTSASFDVRQFRWTSDEPWWRQLPGVLLTAGLLSLGAPFWFNMLKQLTGLRPILANKKD